MPSGAGIRTALAGLALLSASAVAPAQTCNCSCDAAIPACLGVARIYMNESGGPPTPPTEYLTAGIQQTPPAPPLSAEVRHANRFSIAAGTTLTHVCVALKNPSGPAAQQCAGGDTARVFIALNDVTTGLPGAILGASQTNFVVQPCLGTAIGHQLVAFTTPQTFAFAADIWVGVAYPTANVGIGHQGNRDRTNGSSAVWIGGSISQWFNYDDPQLVSYNGRAPIIRALELVRSGGIVDASPLTGLFTDENGGSAQFQVRLLPAPPLANVTVNLTSTAPTEGAPTPASATLTFTPQNWNVPQPVTIVGQDDPLVDGPIAYQIRGFATSTDGCYNSPTTPVFTVDLTNLDNDGACQLRWTQVSGPSPPARDSHAMAYDPVRDRVVLFGGRNMSGSALMDVWEFDPVNKAWAQIPAPVGPLPRHGHAMAYDVSLGRVLVMGGSDGINVFPETWGWNGTSWSIQTPPPGTPRTRAAACISPLSGSSVFRCGGQYASSAGAPDVHLFSSNSWTPVQSMLLPGPAPRAGHGAASIGGGPVVVFGGEDPLGGIIFGDTWRWASTGWAAAPSLTFPSARRDHAMASFSARSAAVMFGGETLAFTRSAETWLFGLFSGWAQQSPAGSPSARNLHAMASMRGERTVLLFGGRDSAGVRSDTWILSDPFFPELTATGDLAVDEGNFFTQAVAASGSGTFSYLWIKDGQALLNGARVSGADTPTLTIGPAVLSDTGDYWCRVSSPCGGVATSNPARVDVNCAADFNNDNVATVADIFAFLTAWFAGSPAANVCAPNTVTVADIFCFLTAWFAGCP